VLVRVGHVQARLLRARFAPALEADGQGLRGAAAAQAHRGSAGQPASGGQPRPLALPALLGVDERLRLERRGGAPYGGQDQHVRMFQSGPPLLAQPGPQRQRFRGGPGWRQARGEGGSPVVGREILPPRP
jgi:hypothetical protein